jgi:hypothetical protein
MRRYALLERDGAALAFNLLRLPALLPATTEFNPVLNSNVNRVRAAEHSGFRAAEMNPSLDRKKCPRLICRELKYQYSL